MEPINVKARLERAHEHTPESRGISTMARGLVGSEILKIAAEIRGMIAKGEKVLNLTVGDFAPKEFPIPGALLEGVTKALRDGHTNYPPSDGMPECREAVQEVFKDRLGLDYPIESVLIASGARPMIAGTYLTLVNPGDGVIYGLPSWNNNHYTNMNGGVPIELTTSAEHGFFTRAADLEAHVGKARLLCLNTPQNPTGTVIDEKELEAIARLVVDENRRRESTGKPALHVMFDQVYWMLTFGGARHHNPVSLVPELAPYTIFIDGISKSFAATGLRVGWAVGPTDVMKRMSAILTHLGSWAPKAEQVATARLLRDQPVMDDYVTSMNGEILTRLELLTKGLSALRAEGHAVEAIAPQGAIYLSMKVSITGRKTAEGAVLATDEDVRKYLLREAGVALVPFHAFGVREDTGWFRASVGAVSKADCEGIGQRLGRALEKLR